MKALVLALCGALVSGCATTRHVTPEVRAACKDERQACIDGNAGWSCKQSFRVKECARRFRACIEGKEER